ncbi:unnamed protein product [marine sediment metagenome]|uniref:Uncharacterized protein n=1 Tax=marine sediment metagenome TaxID=412755 RepID=X1KTS9_9ZZZZ
MRKKLSSMIKEKNKKINRKFAGKKASITADFNKKIKKLLNNQTI